MRRIKISLLLSITISLATIAIIIWLTPTEGILSAIRKIRIEFLLIALAFHAAGWFLIGIRVKALSKAVGIKLKLIKATEIVLSGAFAGGITPSYVGGEPVLVYLLGKEENSSGGKSTVVVFGGRALDVVFFICVVILSLVVLGDIFSKFISIWFVLLGIGILTILMGIFLFYSLYKPEKLKSLISYFGKTIDKFKPGMKKRLYNEIDSFNENLWFLFTKNRVYFGIGFLCTVLFWGLEFSIPYILLNGLGIQINFIQAWTGYVIIIFVTMIPITPGGSGFAEAGASLVYSTIAHVSVIGVFILLLRVVTYYTNLLVGGIISSKVLHDLAYIKKKT